MDKDIEKLSALYDGELSSKETQEVLAKMNADDSLKNTFQKFGLISDLVERHSAQKPSKVLLLKNYVSKINPVMSNLVTAAATVVITLIILYQFDDDRFQVDRESSMQLSSAISSDEAKSQFNCNKPRTQKCTCKCERGYKEPNCLTAAKPNTNGGFRRCRSVGDPHPNTASGANFNLYDGLYC